MDNEILNFDLPEENPAYEIAPGISVEKMKAMFFDENALQASGEQLFRLDRKNHRYYYTFNEAGEPEFYPSITTLISQTTPTSEYLGSWKDVMAYLQGVIDNVFGRVYRQPGIMSQMYMNERASYGTFMHSEYAGMIINKEYDLDNLINKLADYIEREKLPMTFIDYVDDLRKNMLSLAQFMIDTDLQPLAVEISLICREGGFACTLDLPCIINYKGERFPCIIDFKSGKGFYSSNAVQLHGCRMAWNENFPENKIERVFNWRPKDWRNKPTYEFAEQTYSIEAEKLPHLLKIAAIEDENMDNSLIVCNGKINLRDKANIRDNFKTMTLADLVKNHRTEEQTPEETEQASIEEIAGEKYIKDREAFIGDYAQRTLDEEKASEPEISDGLFGSQPNTQPKQEKPGNELKTAKKDFPDEIEEIDF